MPWTYNILTIHSVSYAPANTIHNVFRKRSKAYVSKAIVYTKSVLLPSMINLRLRESSNNAVVLPTASSVRAAFPVERYRFRYFNLIVFVRCYMQQ